MRRKYIENFQPRPVGKPEYQRNVVVISDAKTKEVLEVSGSKELAWRFIHVEGSTFYHKQTKKDVKRTTLENYRTFCSVLYRLGKIKVEIVLPGNRMNAFLCQQFTVKTS